MAFKKTSEGRVFFQNLDEQETEKAPIAKKITPDPAPRAMLRTSQSQAGGAANQSQTQFQIIALLKTLNAKLQNTQAERDAMKAQLGRYETVVTRLEEKANRTHDAYTHLTQSVKVKDKEMLAHSRRAEQIAQEAFGELAEARQLIIDLEEKAEFSEKELKRHNEQRQKIEKDIADRRAELEKFQQTLADHALTNKNLTKRLNKTEEQTETLDLQVNNALSKQEVLDRKIEKTIQERTRMVRKVDRIEEAVMQTRDAMNAKAMVLLTDQDSNGGMIGSASLEGMDQEQIQALLRSQASAAQSAEENQLLPWWKKPMRVNPLGAASFVTIALLAGWLVSEVQKPVISDMDELQIFSNYQASRAEQPVAKTPQENSVISDAGSVLSDIGQAGLDKASQVKTGAESLVSKIMGTDEMQTPEEKQITANLSVEEAQPAKSEETAAPKPLPMVSANKPVNDDIGTLDINDEAAVLRALENDPQALAKQLNALEPSAVPPAKKEHTQEKAVRGVTNSDITKDIPSAFAKNPDQYNKADPNLPDAVKQIEEKALSGEGNAQHDLAAIYTAGHGGVQQDYKRAAYWFEKSAGGNVANAAYNLGVLYHQGLGVKSDLKMAIEWYKAASDMGHPEAQYNLGIAHIEGVGVEYAPYKAAAYFEKAAKNNVTEAAYNLGLIYENGLLGDPKPDEALMWYKISADQGSPEARAAIQQLAKGLGISIEDVNRLADSMKAASVAQENVNSKN